MFVVVFVVLCNWAGFTATKNQNGPDIFIVYVQLLSADQRLLFSSFH